MFFNSIKETNILRRGYTVKYIFQAISWNNLKTHISLHLIWFHEIRIKYVKRKPPRTITRKNAIPLVCHVSMLWPLVDLFLMKRLFSQETAFFIILLEIKTGLFTIEIKWSWALNIFRTGTLCRIFKYSTEYLKVPSNL